jgi:hypothetical protein
VAFGDAGYRKAAELATDIRMHLTPRKQARFAPELAWPAAPKTHSREAAGSPRVRCNLGRNACASFGVRIGSDVF